MNEITIEFIPLHEIQEAPRNPKDHDIGAIVSSFRRFGVVEPAVKNEATGRIVAGHGRKEAMLAYYNEHGEAPIMRVANKGSGKTKEISLEIDGELCLPVLCGIAFEDDQEAEAYLVTSNRSVELGGWVDSVLAETLNDHADNLDGTGYDGDDLDALITDLEASSSALRSEDEPESENQTTREDRTYHFTAELTYDDNLIVQQAVDMVGDPAVFLVKAAEARLRGAWQ